MRPTFLVVALSLTWSIQGPAATQGLGDAAKREKTKRAQSPTDAKVHTNDSILPVEGAPETLRGTLSAPAATTAPPTNEQSLAQPAPPRGPAKNQAAAAPTTEPLTPDPDSSAPVAKSRKTADEEVWVGRLKAARDQVAARERRFQELERKELEPASARLPTCKAMPDPRMSPIEYRDRTMRPAQPCRLPVTKADVDAARAELERARQDLAAVLKEAHAKGVYPETLL